MASTTLAKSVWPSPCGLANALTFWAHTPSIQSGAYLLNSPARTADSVVQFYTVGNAVAKLQPDDARRAPRRRLLKAGLAACNDRHVTISVTVRDISATGAKLRSDGSTSIPDTFVLVVELDGLEADCQVVWRKNHEIGVRFLSAPKRFTPKRTQVINALTPAQKPSLRKKPLTLEPGK
jgi:hypothetical protein